MSTATTKQISYYNSLLDTIVRLGAPGEFSPLVIEVARGAFPARTVGDASDAIDRAKKTVERLKAAAPVVTVPVKVEVPSGHYALVSEGVVKFYEVNNVTEGKWAGFTFVNAQASDDYHKVGREASARILAEIAQNPEAAMKLYGVELGVCGHCHRTLTSDWRKVGIGPVCNKKMGWV